MLGARLVVPDDLDTDQFGTFCGEVVRTGSALDAARAKARLGMGTAGLRYGLASEASYRSLPGLGLPGHEELLLFVDDVRGIEVLESHRAAVPFMTGCPVSAAADLPASVIEALPGQALIVRPSAGGDRSGGDRGGGGLGRGIKGINDIHVLHTAVAAVAGAAADGLALVDPELRAHHNPGRRQVLTGLARRLAHRLATPCPSCGSRGYGRVGIVSGLPCRTCSAPTELPMHEEHACAACPHRSTAHRPQRWADAGHCPVCNP